MVKSDLSGKKGSVRSIVKNVANDFIEADGAGTYTLTEVSVLQWPCPP